MGASTKQGRYLRRTSAPGRRNAAGALEPVPVRAGEAIGDRTVIREGLKPGDAVVVDGAFAVKAQMLKSQLGEE